LKASKFMGDLLATIIKAKTGEKQLEITALQTCRSKRLVYLLAFVFLN